MKSIYTLVLLTLILTSCDTQVGTAISTAVSNIFTGKAFISSSGDSAYEKYKTEAIANPIDYKKSTLVACKVTNGSPNPLSGKETLDLSKIKDSLCTCKTWGTCEANACNCNILCPDNFNILNRTNLAMDESDDNSLAFTNGDQDFYNKDKNYAGYCWGHALVTQRFNRLAKFDGAAKKLFSGVENDEKRRDHYKNIIEKLNNNEPVDIPGFKNLKEFSRHPEIKPLLQNDVKENWAVNAMSFKGLSMVTSSESQGLEYYNKLFDDIEFRLKNSQAPTIVFNQSGNAVFSHAVIVSGSGIDKYGRRYLCLRDNNYPAYATQSCGKKMILKADGTCYYEGWHSKIGKVILSHTENGNTIEQMKNLREKCLGDKNCPAK